MNYLENENENEQSIEWKTIWKMKEETLGKSVANLGEVNCVEGG